MLSRSFSSEKSYSPSRLRCCQATAEPWPPRRETETHVYVVAALVIKKRALERLRKAHSPVCWFKADDALLGLFELALVFRALLNGTLAQSSTGTGTRNIPELGISCSFIR